MDKKSNKKIKKLKWVRPSIQSLDFNKSEGKFGVFDEDTDTQGNQIGS